MVVETRTVGSGGSDRGLAVPPFEQVLAAVVMSPRRGIEEPRSGATLPIHSAVASQRFGHRSLMGRTTA